MPVSGGHSSGQYGDHHSVVIGVKLGRIIGTSEINSPENVIRFHKPQHVVRLGGRITDTSDPMLPFLESVRISGCGSGEKENSPRLFSFVGPGRVCELFRTIGEFADWGFSPLG